MNADRPTLTDDHGDQFPGAVAPARTATRRPGSHDQFSRMEAAYVHKVNSVLEADRPGLAQELADAFAAEFSGAAAAPRDRSRHAGTRLGRFTRRSLRRSDR
jgi:hypothetical protein